MRLGANGPPAAWKYSSGESVKSQSRKIVNLVQRAGDLLVGVAANDKFEDFPLARRQRRDMSANRVQLALQATRYFMTRQSPFD